jgi:hypothetical protein
LRTGPVIDSRVEGWGTRAEMNPAMSLSTALLIALVASGCAGSERPERIVLIVIDTLRSDQLALYGGPAKTPHLDRIARRGQVLRTSVASFHQTSMSMGALFSGRTPSLESGVAGAPLEWNGSNWCGLARFGSPGGDTCIPAGLSSLGEVMRDQGYWTLGVSANILTFGNAGFQRGFDAWHEVKIGSTIGPLTLLADGLERWAVLRSGEYVNRMVLDALDRRTTDRFFLYVHYMDVHDWHVRRRSYLESIEIADRFVGEVLDRLEAEDLLDGTAFVVVGDHGEAFDESHVLPATPRHAGNPSFQQLLEVPLIVAGAQIEDSGALFRTEDVGRLLRQIAGAPDPAGSDLEPGELLVTELEWQTYLRGKWKSFRRRSDGAVTLIDLHADPGEQRDVAAEHPEILSEHRRRVQELTTSLAAPLASDVLVSEPDYERLRVLGYVE